jgi:hypothetical protein
VAAPDAIRRLVERFAGNVAGYRSPLCNETQVRVEFIDPFFSALGWDMANAAAGKRIGRRLPAGEIEAVHREADELRRLRPDIGHEASSMC